MAWNRPSDKKVERKGGGGQRNVHLIGLVAGLIVVIGAAVAARWLVSDSTPPPSTSTSTSTSLIHEVKPSLAPRPSAPVAAKPKYDRPQIAGEIRDGYRLLPNGKLHKVTGVFTSNVERLSAPGRGIHHPVNQTIIDLLRVRPGEYVLGDSKDYYAGFSKDFVQSEDEDIQIREDDSDETKELKEALIATRKELKERQAKGEDLVKVMREAREQLRELHLYREELTEEVKNIAGNLDKDFSEKDISDLVSAANTMLEERGSMPLQLTAPFLYQLREEKIDREAGKQGIVQ